MKIIKMILIAVGFIFSSLSLSTLVMAQSQLPAIDVWKDPQCGCCHKWVAYLKKNGFNVNMHETSDLMKKRADLGMPAKYASCHTALVAGYIVEGHVPVDSIVRLLKEKPKNVIGIAVPGMPPNAPGMDENVNTPYHALLIDKNQNSKIYQTYTSYK